MLNKASEFASILELSIETRLAEYYNLNFERFSGLDFYEINNFDVTFEFSQDIFAQIAPFIPNYISNLKNQTNRIVMTSENYLLPIIHIDIVSELAITDPDQFDEEEQYLPDDRFIDIRAVLGLKKGCHIVSRGATIEAIQNLLQILMKHEQRTDTVKSTKSLTKKSTKKSSKKSTRKASKKSTKLHTE